MKWTRELATKFFKIRADRDAAQASANAGTETLKVAFGGEGANENQIAAEAQACLDGFQDGVATMTPPPPPPVIVPPAVTVITTPFKIQNMVLNADGVYETTPAWLGGAPDQSSQAVLQFDVKSLVGYGKTVTLQARRMSKHPTTKPAIAGRRMNLKIFRAWFDLEGQRYPNLYYGVPDWTLLNADWMAYVEMFNPWDTNTNHLAVPPWVCGDEKWHDEMFEIQYPSALGAADGRFLVTLDGKTMLDCRTFKMNGGPAKIAGVNDVQMTGIFDRFCLQTIFDQIAMPAGSYVKFADARVTVK